MPQGPRHDGPTLDKRSSESPRAPALASTDTHQVLMHRVIALNGVPDSPKPKPEQSAQSDLSRTVHEWGVSENPVPLQKPSQDAQWATHSSVALEVWNDAQLPARILHANIEDAVTQQYNPTTALTLGNTTSDLASLDRALERAGVLDGEETSADTYRPQEPLAAAPVAVAPVAAAPTRGKPAPQMVLVPASVVWAVTIVFSLCALALTGLAIAYWLRGN